MDLPRLKLEVGGSGPPLVINEERIAAIREMLDSGMSVSQVARVTGIGRAKLYRHKEALA